MEVYYGMWISLGLVRAETLPSSYGERDFVTMEDELPAAVSWRAQAWRDAATRLTEVKVETTDDN